MSSHDLDQAKSFFLFLFLERAIRRPINNKVLLGKAQRTRFLKFAHSQNIIINPKSISMKKLLVLLPIVIMISCAVVAQKGSGGMQWGLKIGPDFTTWTGDDADPSTGESKKMRVGLHGGLFVMIPFSDMLFFQPELLYVMNGVNYEADGDKAKISTSYLNIPLQLRIQTSGGFYVIVGPQIGFNLSGKVKYEGSVSGEDDLEDMRGFLFSGNIGFGYKAAGGWGVYARYSKTFSSVFDVEGEDIDIYDSTIMLSLFYMFGMKGEK